MFILPAYAVLVCYLAHRFRRRWVGVLLTLLTPLPPLLLCGGIAWFDRGTTTANDGWWLANNLKGYGVVLHVFTVPYAAVLFAICCVIVCQHRGRKPRVSCPSCHYDLVGNDTGQCPECGRMLPPDIVQAVARTPVPKGVLRLPSYASDEEAALAGERSVRRVRLPEHLQHRAEQQHDVLKHGASRARPHAGRRGGAAGSGGTGSDAGERAVEPG